ncbi:MAG: pyridoxamine 5'-phosphate oxidase family protein [Proteobacteria bacterium]|nr:pyridoxamine 5'-phosphate oxidase family protein [Pseudomonadota bacterium]
MRRKDNEITDKAAIESIIRKATVCRLALSKDGFPYIVPLCFGYDGDSLYFHSALEGKKIDIIGENNNVCFEFDVDHELVADDDACSYGMKYRSVVGFGKAFLIDEPDRKRQALDIIMKQYSEGSFEYDEDLLDIALIIKVDIENMTGKMSGY